MSRPVILILGAAHVQLDLARVARALGFVVHVAAREPGPAAKAADYFVQISITEVGPLRDYARKNGVSVIYSSGSDLAMPSVGALSADLRLPYFASEDAARACNVKSQWRRLLRGMPGQIPFEIIRDPESQLDQVRYPAVIKPVDGQGQRGVALVEHKSDLRMALTDAIAHSRGGAAIAEEYVNGPEISVNGYLDDGNLIFLGVTDRVTWPEHLGLVKAHHYPSALASTELDQKLRLLLTDTCRTLGLVHGPVYAQIKVLHDRDGVDPKLIEITPRVDGCHLWQLWEQVTGVNLLELTLRELSGDSEAEHLKTKLAAFRNAPGRSLVLGFECQAPGSPYTPSYKKSRSTISYVQYYSAGEVIKPVNGRYDKAAYWLEDLPSDA